MFPGLECGWILLSLSTSFYPRFMSPSIEDMDKIETNEMAPKAVEAKEDSAEQVVAKADVAMLETETKKAVAELQKEAAKTEVIAA